MNLPELFQVTRTFPFAVEDVWNAWTVRDEIAQWYGPQDAPDGSLRFDVPDESVSMHPEVGGAWSATVHIEPFDENHHFYGVVEEVEPLRRLTYTMHYTNDDAVFVSRDTSSAFHRIVLDFVSGDGTTLTLTQYGEMPDGEAPRAKAGTESYFDSLGLYLRDHH